MTDPDPIKLYAELHRAGMLSGSAMESTAKAVRDRANRPRAVALHVNSLADAYERRLMRGARRACDELGYVLVVHAGETYPEPQQILDRAHWIAADAHVFATAAIGWNAHQIVALRGRYRELAYSPVFVSVGVDVAGVPSITIDDAGKMKEVVAHLCEEHHLTRIHFIGGRPGNEQAERRRAGFFEAMGARGLEAEAVEGDFRLEAGEDGARRLLAIDPTLQAIVCASDRIARGALRTLRTAGLDKVVEVTGFDEAVHAAIGDFISVDQHCEEQGYRAVRAAARELDAVPLQRSLQVRTSIVLGRNCACGRARRQSGELVSAAEIVHQLRHTVPETRLIKKLVNAFFADMNDPNSDQLRSTLTECVIKDAHHEMLERWRTVLGELRRIVVRVTTDPEKGYLALQRLADAVELIAQADKTAWTEGETLQERVSEVGRMLHAAEDEAQVWEIVRAHFPRLISYFEVFESCDRESRESTLVLGCVQGRVIDPLKAVPEHGEVEENESLPVPMHSVVYPLSTRRGRDAYLSFDMSAAGDWLPRQRLAAHLRGALERVEESEQARVPRARSRREAWGRPQQTRLSLVARLVRDALGCDVVIIYPLVKGEFPVDKIGPATAGELVCPGRMLSRVRESDAVYRVVEYGQSIYIDDTERENEFLSWFHPAQTVGFMCRERIRALSAQVLRWGSDGKVVGVMFCNYRRPMRWHSRKALCGWLSTHAAVAIQQEVGPSEIVAESSRDQQ